MKRVTCSLKLMIYELLNISMFQICGLNCWSKIRQWSSFDNLGPQGGKCLSNSETSWAIAFYINPLTLYKCKWSLWPSFSPWSVEEIKVGWRCEWNHFRWESLRVREILASTSFMFLKMTLLYVLAFPYSSGQFLKMFKCVSSGVNDKLQTVFPRWVICPVT